MIHYYLKTSLFFVLTISAVFLNAQMITPFTGIYQVNQKGGIIFLSNSALGCSSNPPAATGTCQLSSIETPLLGSARNDDFLASYIDVDGDASTFMSSSDSLDLPSCSSISKVFLFWGASGTGVSGFNQVKLKINNGSYQTVGATVAQTNIIGIVSYHCYADVTSLFTSMNGKARVTVADIPSSAIGLANSFGSWNLVVVYKNDAMTMRHLKVYNGLAHVSATNPTLDIGLSGFLTPTLGAVGLEIGIYSHDGDRAVMGDNISFNGNAAFLPMADLTTNPVNDMMNSTVSNNGVLTPFRKPLLSNTMGSDADIYAPLNVLNLYLANAATTATVQLSSSSDDYLVQALTSAIDTHEPDLRATIKARDVNGGSVVPGDIIEYRIKGYNSGSDISTNTFLTDTLDKNLNYIPNSVSVVYGQNLGSKTDVGSDDQVDYNPVTRIMRIRIGAGANASTGGTVTGSPSGLDSTVITFSASVSQSCLKLSCNNLIRARAYISGNGPVFSGNYTVASTPGTLDGAGCAIQGPTTLTVSTSGCPTPSATNTSPVCTGVTNTVGLMATSDAEATYSWSSPLSYTSAIQNPTLSNLTTSLSGIYTVTLAIPASTCQAVASTSVTINTCTPTAVNDLTTTTINTAVTANVATNDINAIPGGTFSILGQPANGTIVINMSTGQYTFTPATSFTGVTTATYQVCNNLPTACSSANITFTVFSNVVANPDVVITTPSVTATGSLLSNDLGIVSGGNYAVTFTQLATGTGTLVINATTGQYTFVPNSAFTGTAITNYTVCNVGVNPQQCSSASIAINVGTTPLAVNDVITTNLNMPVTGNVSTNDSGTSGGTFSITNQPANGTVTINNSTGQFTYTPPASFTGVTTATYNLCNGLPQTCSSAVISITVYPNIVANPDVVNTTPSTTATGSLLTNDTGILSGSAYSISITQPLITVGSFTVNPATGQYTFTPANTFTGTAQTTYTVCNTAVNPQQCSSTTITINVTSLPVATNDGTTTTINTPVVSNAGTNDSGTLGGTFTFSNTSSTTGTLTGNTITGQYTFTPASGFTGTTSTTYTLCNLSSPPCSTATITITVYPDLIAVPDVINTTPATSTTGSLLGNDLGIASGATYSVTITHPAISEGTISINPSTGAYTFVPNPSFTGSASTSYTVCNTSVNPQQCSSANISIYVKPNPAPQNDNIATTINSSVNGNAATNDAGVAGGTFAIVNQPSNGTLTIDPSTGQFTFTPSTSFTGVTSGTYNLCNGAPVTCSTAVITITVYANLQANPDAIVTTPSVSANGSLLANDLGISPGATYTVSVASLTSTTGTLTVNPGTGQYTFIPNPSFYGLAQTTYTVCNTSVNPQQCSSATINIAVGSPPVAENDSVAVKINTPVGGNVSLNDSNFPGGTFSFGAMSPTAGTMVTNATGQFTYTPANGFTGTTSITYTVCSQFSPPCASAILSFTVYPELIANPETISTTMNTAQSGTLTTNDVGIIPGGSYSVNVTPLSSLVGTLNVNVTNGQYTFMPYPGFTGTASTSYVLSQHNGTLQLQSSSASITINVTDPGSLIGIAKSISAVNYSNNIVELSYKIVVKNYSSQSMNSVWISDDLSTTFPSPATFTVVGSPTLNSAAGSQLTLNNSYTGIGNDPLLATSSSLAPQRADTILFRVKVDPHGTQTSYSNTAIVYAAIPNATVTDSSVNGLDPDPDNDGNPGNNNGPTVFSFGLVNIGIAKSAGRQDISGSGCYQVMFKFTVKNYGTTPIYNITVTDNLNNTFAGGTGFTVVSTPTSVNGYLIPNNLYNGSGNADIVSANGQLNPGVADTVLLRVKYCTSSLQTFSNTAVASGNGSQNGGFTGSDVSTDGLNPDLNNNNSASDPGENVPTVFQSGEDFMIPQGFSPNGDGLNDRFEIRGLGAFPQMEVTILNRWGNRVYTKAPYDNSWDGKVGEGISFGSSDLPEGTYFYIIDLGNGQTPLKGYVYINRAVK